MCYIQSILKWRYWDMAKQKKETRHGKHRCDKRSTTFRLTDAERNLAYEVARLEGYANLAEMFRGLIMEKMVDRRKPKGKHNE